jgi:hypothetical protein
MREGALQTAISISSSDDAGTRPATPLSKVILHRTLWNVESKVLENTERYQYFFLSSGIVDLPGLGGNDF